MENILLEAYEHYNHGRYKACLDYLNEFLKIDNESEASLAVRYFDILGRASYMQGMYDEASRAVSEAKKVGGEEVMLNLTQALTVTNNLLSQSPEPFSTPDWAIDKAVLRIGGSLPHTYQTALNNARSIFDANSQTGYGGNIDLIIDAHQMPMLNDGEFDVVCSSHTIEHLINPLLALEEWRRVLKPNGYILSIIPNKVMTFDHKRDLTSLEHLIEDYNSKKTDINWHHVLEDLRMHDMDRDAHWKGDKKAHFKDVIKGPKFNIHVHVFDLPLVYVMHEYAGFKTLGCFEADVGIYYFGKK